ncbi:hypothetical protein VDGE_02058 [Verticillium dahliae]|uniref:Uncharacterized protein n=1 Tax=Verticillium dahliae TaxID=27337 RepID=A0A444RXS0_VERDA|nr:hypothetical protein VDGE_02058 [Verticillium dahliae]
MLHYLGCIKVGERAGFFDVNHQVWAKELERERDRLKVNEPQKDQEARVKNHVEAKMTKWKKQCDRNMERFDHIRKALARSPDERYIVHNFEESLMKWRASAEYGDGVKLIAQSGLNPLPCYLSSRPNHSSTPASESVNLGDEDNARANTPQAQTPISEPPEDDYNPEEDISVHVILYEDSESLPKENFEARGRETHAEPPAKASKELRSKDSLSYVHFPANNMSRALDLYYGQDPPSFDGVIHELQEPYNTKTYMMLRPQYWRGQMHGSAGSAPHSRHMRPMCEAVSSDTELLSQTPRNMVLFMPYLHWETDRLRNKFALEMEVLADQWRTLDQAYYWTLNTTKSRDRDQVVYRATTAKSKDFHQFDNGGWPDHQDLYESPCRSCTAGIQKVSRVMMVDQLWMWVLDEKTLITSFPKRYGTQKYDYSGVHKAIRTKLDRARPNQIRSVFDLGLLVIDECSNTFFDRARKSDRQPQVIDQFSEAIGNVSRKETIAYDKLYKWTDNANLISRRPGNSEMSELHVPLLDINPEAALHREIEDIKEELDIMIYVIKWRIKELEQLRDSALSTCEGVKGLLALKQQQAGVVQAWMSLKQSEETVKQGRSIMLFTVVTIVFLPLTFTAAIFGMNALELGSNGSLKIGQEFATIFPVSIFIIVITLAIAFSTWIRTFLWSIWHVVANTPYP